MRNSTLGVIALLLLASYVLGVGQREPATDKEWPPLVVAGNKIIVEEQPLFTIDTEKLEFASVANPLRVQRCQSAETCQVFVFDFFSKWNGQYGIEKSVLRKDVIMHHYARVLVSGHGRMTGTYVFFLPEPSVFYLWGDCAMNHADPVYGPFAGDPRSVLKRLVNNRPSQ